MLSQFSAFACSPSKKTAAKKVSVKTSFKAKKTDAPKPVKKTKAEMRIAIAKDVLKLLNTKRVSATPGTYLYQDSEGVTTKDVLKDTQFSKRLKKCEVCALGAMFVAEVDINDKLGCKFMVEENEVRVDSKSIQLGREIMVKRLSPFFSKAALNNIENVFEGNDYFWNTTYPDHKKRLQAIMNNIIRNDGTFLRNKEASFVKQVKAKHC